MKPRYPIIAATVAMIAATGNAYAVLNSYNTLSIQNDAVSTYGVNPEGNTGSTSEWYVSSNGPLLDSFFTVGGLKAASPPNDRYSYWWAYMENVTDVTLNGSPQSNIAVAPPWYNPSNSPVGTAVFYTLGKGISILSASGDSATVDMSGWRLSVYGNPNILLGSGAWSQGYSNGVGNIICATGSGCASGSTYTLKYTATVPKDSWNYAGVKFYFEQHGTVGAVPEASTYGMMLAGLGAIGLMVRRRKRANSWPNN